MNNRAYSTLKIKRVSEDERTIEGIASTPTPDRMGDVVEPLGGKFATPLPLLLDHDARQAVGQVEYARATSEGIEFRARIAKIAEPGAAKDLVDAAWQLVKAKLRAAVSIGFRPLPDGVELMRNGGVRYKLWEWIELSLVAIPANAEAQIFAAKSLKDAARAISAYDRIGLRATAGLASTAKRKSRVVRLDAPIPGTKSRVVKINAPPAGKKSRVVRLTPLEKRRMDEKIASRKRREARGKVGTIIVRLTAEEIAAARRGRR